MTGQHASTAHREPYDTGITGTLAPPLHRHAVAAGAVRHAVSRDQDRLDRVLQEPITAVRRQALIGHVGFVFDQLHDHHRVSDEVLWPAAVTRRRDLADLAEQVRAAHRELAETVVPVRTAALQWAHSPIGRSRLFSAVRELATRLGPVADADAELLPLACAALTDGDRGAPEGTALHRAGRRWFLDGAGGPTRLARRMFWLLDELDPKRAELLLQHTPRAAMWVLRNGFSGAYNRGSYLMWVGGGTGPAV